MNRPRRGSKQALTRRSPRVRLHNTHRGSGRLQCSPVFAQRPNLAGDEVARPRQAVDAAAGMRRIHPLFTPIPAVVQARLLPSSMGHCEAQGRAIESALTGPLLAARRHAANDIWRSLFALRYLRSARSRPPASRRRTSRHFHRCVHRLASPGLPTSRASRGAGPLISVLFLVDASAGYWGYRALAHHASGASPLSTRITN